jgi:hypothetical protein
MWDGTKALPSSACAIYPLANFKRYGGQPAQAITCEEKDERCSRDFAILLCGAM